MKIIQFIQIVKSIFCISLPRKTFLLFSLIPAIVSICLFYPGLFSSDSVDQLNQATTGFFNNWHPAIMAITMQLLLPVWGNGGLFVVHQLLYWLVIALLLDSIFKINNPWLFVLGLFPPTYLLSITVWKDTGMAITTILGILLFHKYILTGKRGCSIVSLLCFFYAFSVRTNSIFIIIPSLIILFYYHFSAKNLAFVKSFLTTSVCIIMFASANYSLNTIYKVNQTSSLPSLLLWDVAGLYHDNGIRKAPPPFISILPQSNEKKFWIDAYHPYSCDICWLSNISCAMDPKNNTALINYWLGNIAEFPKTYLEHRYELTKKLYGIGSWQYVTHGYLENEKLGENFRISTLGKIFIDKLFSIIDFMASIFLYQPFSYLLLTIASLLYLLWQKIKNRKSFSDIEFLVLIFSSSSLLNAGTLFFITVAIDYRYMIWTVIGGALSFIIVLAKNNRRTELTSK